MKKIKIIYGIESVGGGALKHLVYLISHLSKEIFNITIILSDQRNEDANAELQKLNKLGIEILYLPIYRRINLYKDFINLCIIISILRKGKFDIIHAHSSKAGGLFRIASLFAGNKNVIYTPHCFYFQGLSGYKRKLFVYLEKILGKITANIIVSEGEMKEIVRNGITCIEGAQNINNAIDFDSTVHGGEINETLYKYGIPKSKFVVGAIGRLTAQKDWETYIYAANEVFKIHPETTFIITGEGELKNEIQKLVFSLGLEHRIILTGYVQEIHKIFGIIDVFVNTSLWEGLPYVILEAMQYKKPVIATDTGNEGVVTNEKTGFITPVKDYKAIAKKVCELIINKQKRIQMGKDGNEILSGKYSFEIFIKKHEELYKKMVGMK